MPPSYRPLKQWLNSNLAKIGIKCNFFLYTTIFFPSMANCHPRLLFWAPEEKLAEMDLEHWNPKQLSFWRCTENKICYIHKISEITKKLGVTVFNFHKLLFRGPKLLPWVKICHAQKKYWSTNKKVTSGLFEYSVKLVSSFHPWNPALCKTDAFSPFY